MGLGLLGEAGSTPASGGMEYMADLSRTGFWQDPDWLRDYPTMGLRYDTPLRRSISSYSISCRDGSRRP